MKNYYDVLAMNVKTGLNEEILKSVCYEEANLKVLSLSSEGKDADIWHSFDKYVTTPISEVNIHLYYKFMSDEDILKYLSIISSVLYKRVTYLGNVLFPKNISLSEKINYTIATRTNSIISSIVSFGVKDTLKPIDEYIAEIKAGKEYKEYI